ncbi:sushi, von Willebrand factor type A, EGF and pentraxin domain-containing protein 1-like [Bolinopsis microptera]|uniref:sushi, von Willebrand factor type A, EGF and pentraxin domain-containing protein 1-like n=1 Tax=Bolinopsis microptera TaxID=2820187 RepID=UPI00307A8D65
MTETQFPLPPDNEVSLKCSPGYTLTGDSTVTCVEGTAFSFTKIPSCQQHECASLPDTTNLETKTDFPVQHGVVVTVNCETGYHLSGADTITCMKGNIYKSHQDPTCIAKTCTGLLEITNLHASVQLQTETQFPVSYGTIVPVQCSEGRTLRGDQVITCQQDTNFSFQNKPRCNDLGTCSEVPLDSNLYASSQFPVNMSTTVDVNCVAGYSLNGDRTITCIQDAEYSSSRNFPYCAIDKCTGLLDDFFNIETNPSLPVDYGTRVELVCIQGYSLTGSSLITCIKDKIWEYEETPHCVLDTCTELPAALSDMTTTSTFPVIVGTVVEVVCEPGHTLAGDNTITCEKGVVFKMDQRPTCTIDHCTRLLTENYLVTDSSFPVVYGTMISVSCEPGYSVMGSKEITCKKGIVFSHQLSRPKCVDPGEAKSAERPKSMLLNQHAEEVQRLVNKLINSDSSKNFK